MTYTAKDFYGAIPGAFTDHLNGGSISTAAFAYYRYRYGWSGNVPPKPMPQHDFILAHSEGRFTRSRRDWNGSNKLVTYQSGDILLPNTFGLEIHPESQIPLGSLYNRALEKLNDSSRGSLDLSIDVAEAGQTVKMFNVLDQIDEFHKEFVTKSRSGKTKGVPLFALPMRVGGKLWLTYTYGIKPLISSLYGAADENVRLCLNKLEHHKARASETKSEFRARIYVWPGSYSTYFPWTGTYKESVSLGLSMTTKDGDLARWSSLNPISLAWELTPFSFVFDWFLDVGGFIRNLETSLLYGNRFRDGYRTNLQVVDATCNHTQGKEAPNDTLLVHKGNARVRNIERRVLTSYPVPYLPKFEVNLGSSRLLSSASLMAVLGLKR
jgi:hypothetical protein